MRPGRTNLVSNIQDTPILAFYANGYICPNMRLSVRCLKRQTTKTNICYWFCEMPLDTFKLQIIHLASFSTKHKSQIILRLQVSSSDSAVRDKLARGSSRPLSSTSHFLIALLLPVSSHFIFFAFLLLSNPALSLSQHTDYSSFLLTSPSALPN